MMPLTGLYKLVDVSFGITIGPLKVGFESPMPVP